MSIRNRRRKRRRAALVCRVGLALAIALLAFHHGKLLVTLHYYSTDDDNYDHYRNNIKASSSLWQRRQDFVSSLLSSWSSSSTKTAVADISDSTDKNSMAACLMVKDDNALLPEWIAYHYTVLPLGHLVVASDVNSTQNVVSVLRKWQSYMNITIWDNTDSNHWMYRFGDIPVPPNDTNHHYLHRQRAFLTSCLEYIKGTTITTTITASANNDGNGNNHHNNTNHSTTIQQQQLWVALVDTDEYITINQSPMMQHIADTATAATTTTNTSPLVLRLENGTGTAAATTSANTSIAIRQRQAVLRLQQQEKQQQQQLNSASTTTRTMTTVLEALQAAQDIAPLPPCHGMPRLLFSALENVTCPEADSTIKRYILQQQQNHNIDYLHMPITIRYVQHATKGAFYPSKWGKVLVDVSRISWEELNETKPKSSHRPLPKCPKPLFSFDESLLQVNHYLGSWERYSSRKYDSRRSRQAFEERAYFSNGVSCNDTMWTWFPTFVAKVGGIQQARTLLRVEE